MSHFHKEILIEAVGLFLDKIGKAVVMQEIPCDSGSLRLPVTPDSHPTVMDMVPAESNIYGCMELDTCNLRSAQLLHVIYVMDVVILDCGENTSHTSNDTGLLTVMDITSPYDVTSYCFLGPAFILSTAHSIPLHLGRALYMLMEEVVVVIFL